MLWRNADCLPRKESHCHFGGPVTQLTRLCKHGRRLPSPNTHHCLIMVSGPQTLQCHTDGIALQKRVQLRVVTIRGGGGPWPEDSHDLSINNINPDGISRLPCLFRKVNRHFSFMLVFFFQDPSPIIADSHFIHITIAIPTHIPQPIRCSEVGLPLLLRSLWQVIYGVRLPPTSVDAKPPTAAHWSETR